MMPSVLGAPYQNGASPMYYSADFMTDELSRQLALSDSMRQITRGCNGQRAQNAMRVVKPSSANNSPQGMMTRRRSLMNDGNLARRRQQALEYALTQQMQEPSSSYSNYQEPAKRASRPVSWHPSSQIQQQPHTHIQMHQQMPQPDYSQYVIPLPAPYAQGDMYTGYSNLPPTPAAYSSHTSPVASFSPLSYPFTVPSQTQAPPPQYITAGVWDPPQQVSPNQYSASGSPGTSDYSTSTSNNYFSLDTSNAHVLNNCTAPPTPDDIQYVQQSQLVVQEESIPYQPLEESEEEEGEILIGMGLYDTPDKTDTDPGLDNYRTSASQLLGTTYRTGQGLKLEEAWEPPASDDEEDEDDDNEDADGEEQEQEQAKTEASQSTPAQQNWI